MKPMKYAYWITLLVLPLILQQCQMGSGGSMLPGVSGKAGEVMIIIDKAKWDADLGDALKNVFMEEQEYLPQPEPMFSPQTIPPANFTPVFQSHRNLIIPKISSEYTGTKILIKQDVYSSPQLVIEMTAPNNEALIEYLGESKKLIQDRIKEAERERIMKSFIKYQDPSVVETLKNNHNIFLGIPRGYTVDVDSSRFIWISRETPSISQAIIIYTYEYTDTNTFTQEYQVRKRNYVMRRNVKGPSGDSWMTTETMIPPEFTEFEKDNRYYSKLRGLWKLEKGAMGGPFVSISTVDEKRNQVVTVEGYVYAPGEPKREHLRQVEAIIHSLKILD
jgi:hypothetical protein